MNRLGACGRSAWLLLVAGILLGASVASAQPDPSIRDWGSPPGTPPPWQTADVFVDNDGNGIGNEVGEPSKGQVNRLFARIRNLGASPASNVTVRFAFAPYGPWSPASWSNFREIGTLVGINLGAAGAPDAELLLEMPWDLNNLSDNNGGAWGGHILGEFDHFCVLVRIEMAGDPNPTNNHAQNNFVNVQTVFGKAFSLKLLIANPAQTEARGELVVRGLPEEWTPRFDGIPDTKGFTLKPREFRTVTLTLQPPPAREEEPKPIRRHMDLSLRMGRQVVGGVSFDATVSKTLPILFPPSGGVLAPYIIGTWDAREGRATTLQLVNPTGQYLYLWVAFFNDEEKPLKCVRQRLSANDLQELEVRKIIEGGFGVAKVVAFNDGDFTRPTAGVIGYQRQFTKAGTFSEAPLQQIPVEILKGDFGRIQEACGK